jgi:ABC-2 type transport system permease protein
MEESVVAADSVHSLSRPVSPFTITYATVVKGLQVARRYLPNLIGSFVGLAVRILFFLLIANAATFGAADEGSLSGRDLFLFFQGALLLLVFNGPTLWGPIQAVTSDLYNGTLEYLYSGPGSRYAYYVGTVLTEVVISLVIFVPFYVFLAAIARAGARNMLLILLVCAVVLVALTAMGVMIALLALLWRQVSSIASVLGMLFEFLGGAYLPVSSFPAPLQLLAYLIPYTWGYDLIRYYSFDGDWQTLQPVWLEWIILGAFAVVFTLLSRYLLQRTEQYAKRNGLHII